MASRYRGVIKIKTMKDKTISASLIYRKIEGKLSTVEEERFGTSGILRANVENVSTGKCAGS